VGCVTCRWFHKWKHIRNILSSQVILRVTCHRQVIREMSISNWWSPEWLRKMFIWFFTCEKADISYNCLHGVSLVLHSCKLTCTAVFTSLFTSQTFFWNWRVFTHTHASYITSNLGVLTQFINHFELRANFRITLTDPR